MTQNNERRRSDLRADASDWSDKKEETSGGREPLVAILSLPRSGSSYLARLIQDQGMHLFSSGFNIEMSPSSFNPEGYLEDVWLALLNDQLIRLLWGMRASMLHIPQPDARTPDPLRKLLDFSYDLDETSVVVPDNYQRDVRLYTGADWDVWGLTRMQPGGKWHQVYSRAELQTGVQIAEGIEKVREAITNSRRPLLIKDPRLALTFSILNLDCRVVIIRRHRQDVLDSMRRHYGPRLFTTKQFAGYEWVSNHFNYQVPPQKFDDYADNYDQLFREITRSRETIEVQFQDIVTGNTGELAAFLAARSSTIETRN